VGEGGVGMFKGGVSEVERRLSEILSRGGQSVELSVEGNLKRRNDGKTSSLTVSTGV
jgi:hypothetical protein